MRLVALASLMVIASPVVAQDAGMPRAMRVPWTDVAPHVEGDAVVTVALGTAGAHHGPLAAQRLWARQEGERRARAALHAWIDGAIVRAMLAPDVIGALHRVVDDDAIVSATRARVDGSACIEMSVPLARLAACTPGVRGLPWSA